MWNLLTFFRTEENVGMVETYTVTPKDPTLGAVPIVSDKIPCYVCLYSVRNGAVEIEEPFLTHFFDPEVYANHMLESQFMGVIVKASPFGKLIIDSAYAMMLKAVLIGGKEALSKMMGNNPLDK